MGLRYYDEALHSLIKSWVNDPKLRVLRPDETMRMFQIRADLDEDKPLKLPLIALSRSNDIEILAPHKRLKSFDGKHLRSTEKETMQLNAIPIKLNYQIDIYTKYFQEADEYVREFLFAIINHPVLKITIPYNNTNLTFECNMRLNSTVTDNSDIPERLFPDQFTRFTIQLELQDAYLYSVPINTNINIVPEELQLVDPRTGDVEVTEKL